MIRYIEKGEKRTKSRKRRTRKTRKTRSTQSKRCSDLNAESDNRNISDNDGITSDVGDNIDDEVDQCVTSDIGDNIGEKADQPSGKKWFLIIAMAYLTM